MTTTITTNGPTDEQARAVEETSRTALALQGKQANLNRQLRKIYQSMERARKTIRTSKSADTIERARDRYNSLSEQASAKQDEFADLTPQVQEALAAWQVAGDTYRVALDAKYGPLAE